MSTADPVKVANCRDQLLEELASFFLLQLILAFNIVRKFASFGALHYEVEVVVGLDYLVQLDDVRMVYSAQDVHLSLYSVLVVFLFDPAFLHYFDGDFLSRQEMKSFLDFSEGSFTEGSKYFILLFTLAYI